MQIIRRYVYDIPVLDLAGRFIVCADPERTALRKPVAMLVSEGRVNVLLHFGRVTDIDAHGLGELAWGVTMLRRSGGQMALIAPNLWVRRLLALTKLDTILPIYNTEADAISPAMPARLFRAATAAL